MMKWWRTEAEIKREDDSRDEESEYQIHWGRKLYLLWHKTYFSPKVMMSQCPPTRLIDRWCAGSAAQKHSFNVYVTWQTFIERPHSAERSDWPNAGFWTFSLLFHLWLFCKNTFFYTCGGVGSEVGDKSSHQHTNITSSLFTLSRSEEEQESFCHWSVFCAGNQIMFVFHQILRQNSKFKCSVSSDLLNITAEYYCSNIWFMQEELHLR